MKKHAILLCCCLIFTLCGLAQPKTSTPLWHRPKIGGRMPDIPLGEIHNNKTGKTHFAQFKGKLVILDFWSTSCLTCLLHMPDMEAMQKQFGDKIQIILVNPIETAEEIDSHFKESSKLNHWTFKLADLPSIVNAKQLNQVFPTPHGLPHHVWIDQNGIIRIMSVPYALYPQKITDILNGKTVYTMNDDNSSDNFQKKVGYNTLLGKYPKAPVLTGSFFTAYNNDYAALTGGKVENKTDSLSRTVRTTYVNKQILELYMSVFRDTLAFNDGQIFYSSATHFESRMPYIWLHVRDTCRYTFAFKAQGNHEQQIDTNFVKSRFCYEQISPLGFTERQRTENRLHDLDQFFGDLYGTRASLKTQPVPCYEVFRTSAKDKLSTKPSNEEYGYQELTVDGRKMIRSFKSDLKNTLKGALQFSSLENTFKGQPFYLADDTGIKGNVDMTLPDPQDIHTLDDFRNAIKVYDLDIRPLEKQLTILTFTEQK